MWILKVIVLLLVVAGAGLALINVEPVRFEFYFGSLDLPLSLILAGALGSGGLLGLLIALGLVVGVRRENARLRRKLSLTQQEVSNLRILPLQDR